MSDIQIKALCPSPEISAMLSEILIETVANGGSVSFMHPLAPAKAQAFWRCVAAGVARQLRERGIGVGRAPPEGVLAFLDGWRRQL